MISANAMIVLVAALALAPVTANAQPTYGTIDPPFAAKSPQPQEDSSGNASPRPRQDDLPEPDRMIHEARKVLARMRNEPAMAPALSRARGVLLVPSYATAALVVGGAGGSGVMLEQRDGRWSAPLFFNIGSASLGLQAGVAVGPLALLLMNQDAVAPFRDTSNFSIDAAAGFTVLNWSAATGATAGRGDVVIWSDLTGFTGDLSISITNIDFDEERTSRYYRQRVLAPSDVLTGAIEDPHEVTLQTEFAEFTRDRSR